MPIFKVHYSKPRKYAMITMVGDLADSQIATETSECLKEGELKDGMKVYVGKDCIEAKVCNSPLGWFVTYPVPR